MLYHHCRPLHAVHHGVVTQRRLSDGPEPARPDDGLHEDGHGPAPWRVEGPAACRCDWCEYDDQTRSYEPAYRYAAERIGFWPLFLAVGEHPDAQRLTGYDNQFRRAIAWGPTGTTYRPAGGFPDDVLLSWQSAPAEQLVHSDYDWWCCALMCVDHETRAFQAEHMGSRAERCIWKSSYAPARWRLLARREPGRVQAMVPQVDLRTADLVRCRSRRTRAMLVGMGFDPERVRVERWRVERHR